MSDLIRREWLKDYSCDVARKLCGKEPLPKRKRYCANCSEHFRMDCSGIRYRIFVDLIETAPTIDAEPVKHGKWVTVDKNLSVYQCSECGDIRQIDDIPIFDFCPRCGARMIDEVTE